MADRYLLESGTPDGYQLEDGSGVLLLDVVTASSTLADNFDDNSRDTSKWQLGTLKSSGTASVTVSEANARLEITPNTTAGYGGYLSTGNFNLTGDSVYCKITPNGTLDPVEEAYLGVGLDSSNYYLALIGGSNVLFQKNIAGSAANIATVAYNATNHAWFRLRESGGTIFLDAAGTGASDPPVAGDWTNIGSDTAGIALTAVKISLAAGVFGSAGPVAVYFDGFNTATSGASVGAAAGVGAATGVGSSIALSPGSGAGVGAATAVGASQAAGVGSASGTSTATATPIVSGQASGTGSATAVGYSVGSGVGSASGTGSASAVGRAQAVSVGSAAGTGSAAAIGNPLGIGAGTASGAATATATGKSLATGVGSSTGVGAATGASSQAGSSVGAASGTGSASAVGSANVMATGSASGVSSANASGTGAAIAAGSASGQSSAVATGKAFVTGAGLSAGFGVAVGAGQSIAQAQGISAGEAAALGIALVLQRGTVLRPASGPQARPPNATADRPTQQNFSRRTSTASRPANISRGSR